MSWFMSQQNGSVMHFTKHLESTFPDQCTNSKKKQQKYKGEKVIQGIWMIKISRAPLCIFVFTQPLCHYVSWINISSNTNKIWQLTVGAAHQVASQDTGAEIVPNQYPQDVTNAKRPTWIERRRRPKNGGLSQEKTWAWMHRSWCHLFAMKKCCVCVCFRSMGFRDVSRLWWECIIIAFFVVLYIVKVCLDPTAGFLP